MGNQMRFQESYKDAAFCGNLATTCIYRVAILTTERLHYLDVARGIAIISMVIYHFYFDLDNFNIIAIDMDGDAFWRHFRAAIVTLFLVTMGMSLALTHTKSICWSCLKKRSILLGGAAILVSIGSYIQFPDTWIFFGVLHFIFFASWLGLLFIGRVWLSLLGIITILIGYFTDTLHTRSLFQMVQEPLHLPPHYTQDLVTIFPWFAPVLVGIFIVAKQWHVYPQLKPSAISHRVAFLGKHSLLIYLIHQPILIGLIALFITIKA